MNRVDVEQKVLNENQRIAQDLRRQFLEQQTFCLNIISSPGSGKTSLLERTLKAFPAGTKVAVLTGDLQTENDARRLQRFGFPARQIITGGTCHLDAKMIDRHLQDWGLGQLDLLIIENVGNLVCPSSYDLGEHAKVVLLSITEGEDKPLKYPSIFSKSELLVLNKIDLLPYVNFDLQEARANALRVHPGMEIIEVSCTQGTGLDQWMDWVETHRKRAFAAPAMAAN
jgi:hydrogenase nickel incorporation protein HypB